MLVFEERGKPEYPEKNLSEQSREPTNSVHIWRRVRESNPGHIGGRRARSPLRQPCCPCVAMDVVNCQLWAKHPQHVAKCRNRMAKRTQHLAPNNVAIVWPGLYNYRRRLTMKIKVSASVWNSHRTSLWTRRRKTNTDSRFPQNNSFHLNLTSCKHRHRYYGHHSSFQTVNFYMKIFWKHTWQQQQQHVTSNCGRVPHTWPDLHVIRNCS